MGRVCLNSLYATAFSQSTLPMDLRVHFSVLISSLPISVLHLQHYHRHYQRHHRRRYHHHQHHPYQYHYN